MLKSSLPRWRINQAVRYLDQGGIIAYPTEAVYGLGCDPFNRNAVLKLLAIKNRPIDKGLILIAAEFAQLAPLLEIPNDEIKNKMLSTWPGPTTWVVPAKSWVPRWLRGQYASLAVRVTNHPIAADLCRSFDCPLVSTSANMTGSKPIKNTIGLRKYFRTHEILIVPGLLGAERKTTEILDAVSGEKIR